MSQKIDIWSLGCVLSIAASWVIGGYNGVLGFERVRKNAVAQNKAARKSLDHVPQGDLFHDGSKVLSEVTDWHKAMRGAIRSADRITGRVLDLIDSQILLEIPSGRIDAKQLHLTLQDILDKSPIDPSNVPASCVRKALLELEVQVSKRSISSSQPAKPPNLADSWGTTGARKLRKAQIPDLPLRNTAHRFALDPGGALRREVDIPAINTENLYRAETTSPLFTIDTSNTVTRRESKRSSAPPMDRSAAPLEPRNVFQARNQMKGHSEKRDWLWFWKPKHVQDADLERFFKHRDIVSRSLYLRCSD